MPTYKVKVTANYGAVNPGIAGLGQAIPESYLAMNGWWADLTASENPSPDHWVDWGMHDNISFSVPIFALWVLYEIDAPDAQSAGSAGERLLREDLAGLDAPAKPENVFSEIEDGPAEPV